jgi:hypothetical protein
MQCAEVSTPAEPSSLDLPGTNHCPHESNRTVSDSFRNGNDSADGDELMQTAGDDSDVIHEELLLVDAATGICSAVKQRQSREAEGQASDLHPFSQHQNSWFNEDLLSQESAAPTNRKQQGRDFSGNHWAGVVTTVADGSNSTVRFSLHSGTSGETVDSFPSREPARAMAFFSLSIYAPHTPEDTLELQKRLHGVLSTRQKEWLS